jgi:hypothetical protein
VVKAGHTPRHPDTPVQLSLLRLSRVNR